MFKLFPSRNDRVEFITSLDEAVESTTAEGRAAYLKYIETLDRSCLILKGEPIVFVLRPLSWDVYEDAIPDDSESRSPLPRELFRLSIESIAPWPKEWGEESDIWRYERRRKVPSVEFVSLRLPPGCWREAARMLLSTLPSLEKKKEEEKDNAVRPFAG